MLIKFLDLAILFAIGILLGIASDKLLQLLKAGAWTYIALLLTLSLFYIFIIFGLDKLLDRILPSGVVTIYNSKAKRYLHSLKLLSLMLGFLSGLALAHFGFGNAIIKFFSYGSIHISDPHEIGRILDS